MGEQQTIGSGLEQVFPALSRAAFFREHWLKHPCVAHAPLARLAAFFHLDSTDDFLRQLLAGRVSVDAQVRTPDGKFTATTLDRARALDAYDSGVQIYIHLDPREPGPLAAWSEMLHEELGLPAHWGELGVYAARRGGQGVDWHFDRNENIMLQLAGRKVWKLAANETFAHPMANQMLAGSLHPLNAIARTCPSPLTITGTIETIAFEPGTAAYIPRGHWHETESGEEGSLSVGFVVSLRTWGETAARKLLNDLLADPNLRAVAPMFVAGEPAVNTAARDHVEKHIVPALRAFAEKIEADPDLLIARREDLG